MAKVNKAVTATLGLNPDKGGAWLALFVIHTEDKITTQITSAWKNASAGKRWIKERVKELTPRKSIKFEVKASGENGKPSLLMGQLEYKE